MNPSDFSPGENVTYTPHHGDREIGIVKSVNLSYVFVVYKCDHRWDRYQDYTAAATSPEDLTKGWK